MNARAQDTVKEGRGLKHSQPGPGLPAHKANENEAPLWADTVLRARQGWAEFQLPFTLWHLCALRYLNSYTWWPYSQSQC